MRREDDGSCTTSVPHHIHLLHGLGQKNGVSSGLRSLGAQNEAHNDKSAMLTGHQGVVCQVRAPAIVGTIAAHASFIKSIPKNGLGFGLSGAVKAPHVVFFVYKTLNHQPWLREQHIGNRSDPLPCSQQARRHFCDSGASQMGGRHPRPSRFRHQLGSRSGPRGPRLRSSRRKFLTCCHEQGVLRRRNKPWDCRWRSRLACCLRCWFGPVACA